MSLRFDDYSSRDRLDLRIALAIFAVYLLGLLFLTGGKPGYGPDGAYALNVAHNVASGNGVVVNRVSADNLSRKAEPWITKPPLFPVAIALLALLGLQFKLAGLAISAGACAAAAGLLYLLARQALPRTLSLLVTLVFAAQVTTIRWGTSIHEESLFVAISFATLLWLTELLGRPRSAPWWQYAALGFLAAAAMLTSYQGVPLLLVVSAFITWQAWREGRIAIVMGFLSGLAITAAWPFLRFVQLWSSGVRPGFDTSEVSTYYKMLAGIINAFQNDVLGRLVVWLYNGSATDIGVVVVFLFVGFLLVIFSWRWAGLRPLALYVALYLGLILADMGGLGKPDYEPRYNMPIYGPVFIIGIFVFFQALQHWRGLRLIGLSLGTVGIAFFVYGQGVRYPVLLNGHGEMCPAPQTLQWVRAHIPDGAVITAGQCGVELLAGSNRYFWLPIPPVGDVSNNKRWAEDDFLALCERHDVNWIVLFDGIKGDPLGNKPGYGPFVEALFSGKETAHIKLAARPIDGLIFKLQCQRSGPGNLNKSISGEPATVDGPSGRRNGAEDDKKSEMD